MELFRHRRLGQTIFHLFLFWGHFIHELFRLSCFSERRGWAFGLGSDFQRKNRWMLFSDMSQSCDVKICYKFRLCPGIILWSWDVFAQNWHFLDPLLYFSKWQQYLNKFKVFFQLTLMIQNLSLNWWQDIFCKNLYYLFRSHWKSDNSRGIQQVNNFQKVSFVFDFFQIV